MSTTAGKRPLPSAGRCTSPTRLTPSLAGIVTSASVVSADAHAGTLSIRAAMRTTSGRAIAGVNVGASRNLGSSGRAARAARPVTGASGLDADLLGDGELLAVDRAGRQQRVAALLDALLELHLQGLEAADRLRRGRAEH